MAWIEVHQSLFTHRKTLILASELGLDLDTAAVKMIRLWSWAIDNAPHGDLSGLPAAVVAFGAQWAGDADAFIAALHRSGFLDEDETLHDWWDYAGRLIDQRRRNAERMRSARARTREDNDDPPDDTCDERAEHMRDTFDARAGATVPNQTVPNQTSPDQTEPEDDASFAPVEKNGASPPSSVAQSVCRTLGVTGRDAETVAAAIADYPAVPHPVSQAKRLRSKYDGRWPDEAGRRAALFYEWMKREAAAAPPDAAVEDLPPPGPAPPSSGNELFDRLMAELAETPNPDLTNLTFVAQEGRTLTMGTELRIEYAERFLSGPVRQALGAIGKGNVGVRFVETAT